MTDFGAYVDAASRLVGLPIRPEHRDEVISALAMIMAQAELVLEFPLPATIEPAPRFIP